MICCRAIMSHWTVRSCGLESLVSVTTKYSKIHRAFINALSSKLLHEEEEAIYC
jgi:hypothetical protein